MWATLLAILFCIVCLLLMIIILLQRGRGGGLSGAFGGAGGQSAFGGKTGDVFTVATIIGTAVYLLMAVFLVRVYVPQKYESPTSGQPEIAVPATQEVPSDLPLE